VSEGTQPKTRLLNRIETALTRRCPNCGGELYRTFSILDKIGLYIPLPHTIYAMHQCERCGTRYRSFRSGTDLFLEVSWLSALLVLGEFKPFALACTATWLVVSVWLKGEACVDTVAAGVLVGVLWVTAWVFSSPARGDYFSAHPIIMVPTLAVCTLVPVALVLVLDRYTTFGLREYHTAQR
jgi:uncharacterized protein (DUF983 family)